MSAKQQQVKPKTVLEMILDWSEARPDWQRDALRRIVVTGSLTDADVADILRLTKKENGATDIEVQAVPLSKSHLPANPGAGQDITLHAISGVAGVNQLAPKQVLEFGPNGLTIIYGDNGAGKSGYSRILKRACGARARAAILPNAFDDSAPQKAHAEFLYAVGGILQPQSHWKDDDTPHEVLSAVSIFDRDSGAVHIRDKNEIAFRPFGLDIPDELAAVCQQIKDLLVAEREVFEQARDPVFDQPTWHATTTVGQILDILKPHTDLTPLESLAQISDEDRDRHTRLTADLAQDPDKAAKEQEIFVDALAQLAKAIRTLEANCSDKFLTDLKAKSSNARAKRQAATVAAAQATGSAQLEGVGDKAWRTLWEAARNYSQATAYSGEEFPVTIDGALCVLCHQPLSTNAKERLTEFEAFVQAETEKQAKAAEADLDTALLEFNKLAIRTADYREIRRRVALTDASLARTLLRFLAAARLRLRICTRSLDNDDPLTIPPLPEGVSTKVEMLSNSIKSYAAELRKATDPTARAKLEHERDELADRLALGTLLPKAKAEIDRLKALAILSDSISATSTNAITKLGNHIADHAITPKIRDQFQDEIIQLAANRVRVEITRSGGKFGSPLYEVKFFANPKAKVSTILSEGEQTCVALAAFLTELALADHKSALVFDDPVSSLDHRWRKKVAERLVKEAAVRQVIVFTHDLVFVHDLKDLMPGNSEPRIATLAIGPSGSGIVSQGLPWSGASVKDRLDKLEKDARASRSRFDANDEAAYCDDVFRIYSGLRATWERAIEDVAFNGVLLRHRDYVNTKNLRKTIVLNSADCDAFETGFKRCCDIIDSHDPSRARGNAPPSPDEILTDITALRSWVDDLRKRQKDIG